jgi:hypothetical protein
MHGSLIAIELTVGAAILALWVELRVGERRPASFQRRIAHTAAAYAVLQLAGYGLNRLVNDGTPPTLRLLFVFLLILPALIYAFVVAVWVMRTLREAVA